MNAEQQAVTDAELLRAAAAKVRRIAQGAPRGPYSLGPPGYHRLLLGGDGDPFGAVRDWSGGIGDGTGTRAQTGAHIALWSPVVALAVAAWLESAAVDAELVGACPQAVAVARAVLEEEALG